jgi:hypothetical protein
MFVNGESAAFTLMLYLHEIASRYGAQVNKKAKSDSYGGR